MDHEAGPQTPLSNPVLQRKQHDHFKKLKIKGKLRNLLFRHAGHLCLVHVVVLGEVHGHGAVNNIENNNDYNFISLKIGIDLF